MRKIPGLFYRKGLFFLLLIVAFPAFAGQRSAMEALAIATDRFVGISKGKERVPAAFSRPVLVHTENISGKDSDPLYYVFNQQFNRGFVIVSAESRTVDVLGYADSGSFNPDSVPPGLQYWLNQCRNEIVAVREGKAQAQAEVQAEVQAEAQVQGKVVPLLQAIKWNQSAPYNDLCPVINAETKEKAATGCVATGMAQVMKYFQWPEFGYGSKKYTTKTLKLPVDARFSLVRYDWKNMTNAYGKGSTSEQINAVATLMYHCGAAVEMDFDKASAASVLNMGKALIHNFGYDNHLQLLHRDYYSRQEWLQIIKNELNQSRPVIYSGSDVENSGHLFICDGYDEQDYLHFNWGWGGLSDGYFHVSELKPPAGDAGAGNGDGYFYNQSITVGIQKPNRKSVKQYSMYLQSHVSASDSLLKRKDAFSVSLHKVYNLGLHRFKGKFGLALFQNNRIVSVIKSLNISDLDSYYGYTELVFDALKIPAAIAPGNYLLYPVFKSDSETGWTIIRGKNGTFNHFQIEIAGDSMKLNPESVLSPDIQIMSFEVKGKIYQHRSAGFDISIFNKGTGDYHSNIDVYLQHADSVNTGEPVATTRVSLNPGETKTFSFKSLIEKQPGKYLLKVCYDKSNDISNPDMTATAVSEWVQVLSEPSGTPDLKIVGKIAFADAGAVHQHDVSIRATITNQGSRYEDEVIAFVFPDAGGSSLTYLGYQTLSIDSLETVQVNFSGDVYLNPSTYKVAVYQRDKDSWKRIVPAESNVLSMKLLKSESSIGLLPADFCQVLPNPATNVIKVSTNLKANRIRILSVSGQIIMDVEMVNQTEPEVDVSGLTAGFYGIKITDSAGKVVTGKFMKR